MHNTTVGPECQIFKKEEVFLPKCVFLLLLQGWTAQSWHVQWLQGKGADTSPPWWGCCPVPNFLTGLAKWYARWCDRDLIFRYTRKLCILCILIEQSSEIKGLGSHCTRKPMEVTLAHSVCKLSCISAVIQEYPNAVYSQNSSAEQFMLFFRKLFIITIIDKMQEHTMKRKKK